jgi:hypothetical protein
MATSAPSWYSGAMRARTLVVLAIMASVASAQLRPRAVGPNAALLGPWTTLSCWVEPRWFDTLRNGPMDFCKRSLRYRPGHIDCLTFTDQVCWSVNQVTGEYQQLRTSGIESLIACPPGPEPPTSPRLH